ncbi:hypothetical protein MKK69_12485 [Methylobacterium sp. J-026]|uniref:hypothetical protein n=1 Tax=Methylobacterium sp. J-026 TaxID=2836624 RepID=UPI001FBB60E7|nr:hypothetical protein [Methylobacterium sp. J-026]MCJ2134868.1 hypothetical protein [Methylobacterium sp. J-026]
MTSIEALSATLWRVAAPGMTPKALRAAVREHHPEASKKHVVRAAFYALIDARSQDGLTLDALHGFALNERTPSDEPPVTIGKSRRQKHRRSPERAVLEAPAVPEASERPEAAAAA